MQVSGIRKHQIMDSMLKRHGGYVMVGFTARDLYNICHRNKLQMLSAGDDQTIMNYLIAQKHRDPDFYFDHKRDGGGHMTGVLWCDFQYQMDYRALVLSSYLMALTKPINTTCLLFLLLG
jgi:zinc finger SWIM domain-containing protein 3